LTLRFIIKLKGTRERGGGGEKGVRGAGAGAWGA